MIRVGLIIPQAAEDSRLLEAVSQLPEVRVLWHAHSLAEARDLLAAQEAPLDILLSVPPPRVSREDLAPYLPEQTAMIEGPASSLVERLWQHFLLLLEEQERESSVRLRAQQKVMAYTREELQKAYDDLLKAAQEAKRRERLAGIGQMASAVVHDLRNPLTAIGGFADVLERDDLSSQERAEFLEIIKRQAERMRGMIQDILDFTRGGQLLLERRPLPARQLLKLICDTVSPELSDKQIKLDCELEADFLLEVDPDRLTRAVVNLVLNARDAVEPGGRVSVSLARYNEVVQIRVADNGPGIPPEILHTIFEPFVTIGKKTGTGLGLAITRQMVEAHGGTIGVHSRPGEGAIFTITLPAPPAHGP